MVSNEQRRSWKAAHLAENYGMGAARMADYGFHSRQAKLEAAPACVRWMVAQFPKCSLVDRRNLKLDGYASWAVHAAFSPDGEETVNNWSFTVVRVTLYVFEGGRVTVSMTMPKIMSNASEFSAESHSQDDVPLIVGEAMTQMYKILQQRRETSHDQ